MDFARVPCEAHRVQSVTNMKILSLVIWVGLGGCGSSSALVTSSTDAAVFVPTGPPAVHRETATTCGAPVPGTCGPDVNPGEPCLADTDCSAQSGGSCIRVHGSFCTCTYNDCAADAECGAEQLCACNAAIRQGNVVNHCLPSNCKVDSDCGTGQYCGAALDDICGSFLGVARYACTTPNDRCRTDRDCGAMANQSSPFCTYSNELGYWYCSRGQCAG